MSPFDPTLVPAEHADLFYSGKPDAEGNPVGLTDEEYDTLKAERGSWPPPNEEEA